MTQLRRGRASQDKPGFGVAALAVACGCVFGCSGEPQQAEADLARVESDLTKYSDTTLWGPGATIDTCVLTTQLPTQQAWIREAIYRTWEFASNVHVNWLPACPATGMLIRIGIHSVTPSEEQGQGGWSADDGMDARRDERAQNEGHLGSPVMVRPSIKLYIIQAPTDQGRVEYLGVHEYGHILGFAHEQDHPNNNGDCTSGVGSVQTAVTAYDQDSIMNYCNSDGNGMGRITSFDVQGAQALYGVSPRYIAAMASVSTPI